MSAQERNSSKNQTDPMLPAVNKIKIAFFTFINEHCTKINRAKINDHIEDQGKRMKPNKPKSSISLNEWHYLVKKENLDSWSNIKTFLL